MNIRPFQPSPAEYTAATTLRNLAQPDNPTAVSIWQHWDNNRPANLIFERWVVEQAGELLAYGQLGETAVGSGTFYLDPHVHPAYQGGGLTARLFNHLLNRALTYSPHRLYATIRENQGQKLAWLSRHGFTQTHRYPVSHLQVPTFNLAPYAALRARVMASGIIITSLAKLAPHDPLWQHRIHELDWAIMQDVPRFEPIPPRTLTQFATDELEHPNFLPEGWLLALDHSRKDNPYVALSTLVRQGGSTGHLTVGLTGVRREYRRRGLATALKVAAIEAAQQLGTTLIVANNKANTPMYRINQKLGFIPQPAWLDWLRVLVD